jgi:hypothetical protein
MSSYYTDSEINDYEEENTNELFRFDTSLIVHFYHYCRVQSM